MKVVNIERSRSGLACSKCSCRKRAGSTMGTAVIAWNSSILSGNSVRRITRWPPTRLRRRPHRALRTPPWWTPLGRIVLGVDVSPWLRPDAPTCSERLFCHVYGRGRGRDADQRIPGWPYQLVAALESGPTSWTAVLDVVRLGPADDATAV